MASIYSGSDAGKSGLEMVELDGSPDVRGITKIKVSNTTLTDDGNGEVTLVTGGGGGGGGISGTIANTQVAYGTAADTIGGDGNLTWDSSDELLTASFGKIKSIYEVVADVDISRGEAVYITGFQGASGKPTVALAQANNSATMPSIGIATSNINAGQQGFVIFSGQINGTNTVGTTANDTLYVSATTAGALTNVKPTGATELIQNVGRVIEVGASGKIAVSNIGRVNDVPNSFTISGSISAGSLNLTTPLAVADGGTGATTNSGARTNLGLGTMATQDANAVAITGGSITGVTGLAEPSQGSANQLNVSDGSGGWNSASLYYGTGSNGQLAVGTSTPHSYTFKALAGNGSGGNVALFQTLEATASVVFRSSTSTSTNVAIKSNNNTMTLVSGGVDFAFPTADGSNGDVLTTNGAGSLSFTTPTGGGVTLTGSTNNTISTVTGANALQGEANLTFDGTVLTVTGNLSVGVDATSTVGFMGVTPVVQQNANPYSANPTDPSSLASLSATADGNFGDIQNSIGSIITALQQYGLLA